MRGYYLVDIAHHKDGKHQRPQNCFYDLLQQESASFVTLLFKVECIERAFEFGKSLWNDMEIYCRGFYRLMPEKTTDCVKVGSLVKEVGCEAVTEAVDAAGFGYAGFFLLTIKTFRAAA
jgi:hypothetical protein